MLRRLAGFLFGLLLATAAQAQVGGGGGVFPLVCGGGAALNSVNVRGLFTCGAAVATGTINTGGPQAITIYSGSGTTVGPGTLASGLTLLSGVLAPDLTVLAPLASPTFTGAAKAPTPATATSDTTIATAAYVKAQGFTLGSTSITLASGTIGTVAGLTLSGATLSGTTTLTGGTIFTGLTNAPLLATNLSGTLQAITLGTNLSLSGTTLNATGGGGGSVTWPASNDLIVSNSTNSPSGLAPVNNNLLYAAGNAWLPLPAAASSVLCWNASSVPSACSPAMAQTVLGYLTTNQTITIGGDGTGSGQTSINLTNSKVNGTSVPASPLSNTVLAATSSTQGTWETGAGLAALSGFGDMLTQNHGAVNIVGGTITGIATAVNPGDVPNKAYVDGAITGAILHTQVQAATAAVLPNTPVAAGTGVGKTLTSATNTALVVDGYTVLLNDRVLVKNQAAPADNGIYLQTVLGTGAVKWVLTRATDFDQAVTGEVALGAYVFVANGTANAGSVWQLGAPTPSAITVDTTALTFDKLSSSSNVSADGTTILNTGGVLSVITSGALDILGSTRGSIVERGAGGWAAITPGTSGFVFTSNGAAADPSWQAAATGVSGQASGKLAIGGSASTITSNIAFASTSTVNAIAQMGSGGLLDPGMLPLATAGAFGAIKCGTGTTCTSGTITAAAGLDTVTTGIAAGGTTLAAATDLTTQQNYVASGANCTTYPNCIGTAGVRLDAALMVAGNHVYVTNEDPSNAMLVYPDTVAHTINNQAAGAGIAVQANQTALLIIKSATALRTVP